MPIVGYRIIEPLEASTPKRNLIIVRQIDVQMIFCGMKCAKNKRTQDWNPDPLHSVRCHSLESESVIQAKLKRVKVEIFNIPTPGDRKEVAILAEAQVEIFGLGRPIRR